MLSYIKNWQLHTLGNGVQVFTGIVEKDTKGRFEKGHHMRSSMIASFNRETGELHTQNSIYMMDMATENQDPYFSKDMGNQVLGVFYE